MKLVEFSVTNFRSITKAHKIKLQDMTVLVGKNNEGKSNLLTALNVAMEAIIQHSQDDYRYVGPYRKRLYLWERDFPISLQKRKSGLESIFTLHFRLEGEELTEFHDLTKIRGNKDIPITVRIGKDNTPKIEVPKRGSSSYNKKSRQVTHFISTNISFNYIQAVRTENMALEALRRAIYGELLGLRNNNEYAEALGTVDRLEQEALDKISAQLKDPLKIFLPNLKNICVKKSEDAASGWRFSREFDVLIDDGELTSITNKGDGIKSLVTLAVLKERGNKKGASVIAIEEPESHLHSGAIHSLIDVINVLSEHNQIIITTHNPLFVRQNNLNSNIIVDSGMARPAKNIGEIRNILGVIPSDNLQNSRFVLLVEGEDDKISLNKILSLKSADLRNALRSNQLVIKPLAGASNLMHDAMDLKNSLCSFVVLLDNDKAGREALEKAKKNSLIKDSQVKLTICNGSPEAEFEDCIRPEIYTQAIEDEYSVNLKCKEFKRNAKWSDRMKSVFLSQGTEWTDATEKNVKMILANRVEHETSADLNKILINEKAGFIDGLIIMLKKMMQIDEQE
jgi:predicted ATP-dependent endonuclease of OLD family